MRARLIGAALIAAVVTAGPALADASKDVLAAQELWRQAMIKKDPAALEKVLHPGLSFGHSSGLVETKAQAIDLAISMVDLTTLDSDSDRRDGALQTRGLESDRFPTATFRLTEPVALSTGLTDGERAAVSATGELTIHGVTNEATIELQAELQGDAAVVVGSAPIALADYGIDPPTGLSVLSISGDGTFEFQLFFSKG